MEEFRNEDGTYTSPKNGKTYKSLKAFRAHWFYTRNPNTRTWSEFNSKKLVCEFCSREINLPNVNKHFNTCYLNPVNIRPCVVCEKPIKNGTVTCGYACSNTYFRSRENNGSWKGTNYQTICFDTHGKKCIVCGEEKIVAVHHYDHNHNNNDPANLVPMCPTHHQYLHSRYKDEIQPIVDKYVSNR